MSRKRVQRPQRVMPVRPKGPYTGFVNLSRDAFTWDGILFLLIGIAVTVYGVITAASDIHGDEPWGVGIALGPAIVAAYTTLNLCWRGTDYFLVQWGFRVYGVSGIAAIICSVAAFITLAVVPLQFNKSGFNYWLSGPFWMMPTLVGFAGGLAASTAVFLVITLPFVSVMRSRIAIRGNMLSLNPRYAAQNRRAMIALSVMLILVFVIPTFIIVGNQTLVWIGIALIPLGIFLMIYVSVSQRPARWAEILGVEDWQQTGRAAK